MVEREADSGRVGVEGTCKSRFVTKQCVQPIVVSVIWSYIFILFKYSDVFFRLKTLKYSC